MGLNAAWIVAYLESVKLYKNYPIWASPHLQKWCCCSKDSKVSKVNFTQMSSHMQERQTKSACLDSNGKQKDKLVSNRIGICTWSTLGTTKTYRRRKVKRQSTTLEYVCVNKAFTSKHSKGIGASHQTSTGQHNNNWTWTDECHIYFHVTLINNLELCNNQTVLKPTACIYNKVVFIKNIAGFPISLNSLPQWSWVESLHPSGTQQ